MFKGQDIKAGDNSTNVQGKDVTIINNSGISYSDAKEIAMDVFKKNFYDLGQSVEEIVNERAEKILEKYLSKINSLNPKLILNTEDPDIRYNTYEVQKDYARRGNEEIANLLVDILSERTKNKEESLKNLVLNEAIQVVSKLTTKQINVLSLIFLIKYVNFTSPISVDYFLLFLRPIKKDITINSNDLFYQHLEFAGCLSVSIGSLPFKQIIEHQFQQIHNEQEANQMINSNQELLSLQQMWDNSKLCNSSLTSVGIAIALSNLNIKTKLELDYNIWIHE